MRVPAATPKAIERDAGMAADLATLALLAVVVFGVYGRTLDAPFVFDDRPGIVENPSLRRLWPPVGTPEIRGPLNPPPLAPTARRPLPNLSFALNYRLGGLAPAGYRFVNLLLHVFTAAVLAALVRRTLRLPYFAGAWERTARPAAVAVALVWAVHPLVSEAVVYVTQRTELLAALCYLTTLWAALRHWTASSAAGRRGWLVVAGLVSVAGMASKEVVASVPLAVLLYERTFLVESWQATRRSWPLHLTLALGWVVLLLLSAGGVGGLSDARHWVPVHVWWMTQAKVLLLYGKLAVWPWPLAIHYAPRYLRTVAAAWPWLGALALVSGATLAVAWRRPAVRFVLVVVVLVLAPTLVIPLPKMIAAERRMYLPLAGLIALALLGAGRFAHARWPRVHGRIAVLAVTALVVGLAAVTSARLEAYASAVTLWRDTVRHQPDDAMAHYNLGVALLDEDRPAAEVMPSFEQALRLDPDHTGALDNLGLVLNRLGRPEEARRHLERALTLEPDDVVAHNNLGIALTALGRPEEAIPHLERALVLEVPLGLGQSTAKVHVNLGNALLAAGRGADALAHFERAIQLRPGDPDDHYNLGAALLRLGRLPEALAPLERALALAPADVEARNNLATTHLRMGATDAAIEHYRRALVARPDRPDLHNNLGTALLVAGRRDEAMRHFEEALRLAPDHRNTLRNLASALVEAGRPREAIARFEQLLRLEPNDALVRFTCALAYASVDEPRAAAAMAEEAGRLARRQDETALAAEIDAWLAAPGRR